MEQLEDLSDLYEIGETVAESAGSAVYRATEKSIGAPCYLHRISMEEALSPRQVEAAAALGKRYARLMHPRAPKYPDAWFAENLITIVEYRMEVPALTLAENPMRHGSQTEKTDFIVHSLDLIAAFHRCGLIHGDLQASSFGVGPGGKVYLVETRIDLVMQKRLQDLEDESAMVLSTNLFARDVAAWAYAILSMTFGEEIVPNSMDDKWDDFHFQKAENRLRELSVHDELKNFYRECLRGFAPNAGRFDMAVDAMRHWEKNNLEKYVR